MDVIEKIVCVLTFFCCVFGGCDTACLRGQSFGTFRLPCSACVAQCCLFRGGATNHHIRCWMFGGAFFLTAPLSLHITNVIHMYSKKHNALVSHL
jgi:hypothetical protein